jgi:eukaryotic-like serine/threonine-protein kinase
LQANESILKFPHHGYMRGSERQALSRMQRRALDRLLTEYLEQATDDRVAFLRRCHQRWPRLTRWFEELISAERGMTLTLLDKPLRGVAHQVMEQIEQGGDNQLDSGYRLGPWRIIELAGEGGLGKVYRGERADGAFEMTVAIKLLKLRGAGLAEQLQRECRLLARLDDSAISRLLDAGLDEQAGPFLVMEWVEGQDLSEWVESKPSRERCLEVMMELCKAVDHAHRQMIVHGDIKPGNVRVDGEGRVKLLDFGIARLVGATDENAAAIAALTPSFAPPEQHRGEPLDARSDVWALGALLSWMLRGGRLYESREQSGEQKADPDAIDDAELLAVIDKACADEPGQRYASASDLMADLQRYRKHRPLAAMPASAGYRVRKFLRRNPVLVGGITATAVALVAGLIATAVWYVEANHKAEELASVVEFQERHMATIEVQKLGQAMRRDLFDQRREALAASGLSDEEVESALGALESALTGVNFTTTALAMLDTGIFEHAREAIDHRFADQPLIRASLLQTLASTMRKIGLVNQAVVPQEDAVTLLKDTLGEHHRDTLKSMQQAAVLAQARSDHETAQSYLEPVLEARRRVLGDNDSGTLHSAHALARNLQRLGRYEEAEELAREVLDTRLRRSGLEHPETLTIMVEYGRILRHLGQFAEAMPYFYEAAEVFESELGPDHQNTLATKTSISTLLGKMERFEEALEIASEVYKRRQRRWGDNHPETLIALNNLAGSMRNMENHEQAEAFYLEALERTRRIFGEDHRNMAGLLTNLGRLYRQMGRLSDSERILRRALDVRNQTDGPKHRNSLNTKHQLARVLYEKGRLAQARELQARAIAGIEQILSPEHWTRGAFLCDYGRVLKAKGEFEQAESRLLTAREILVNAFGNSHSRARESTRLLAELYRQWAASEPDAGHDESRAEWLAQLESNAAEDDL